MQKKTHKYIYKYKLTRAFEPSDGQIITNNWFGNDLCFKKKKTIHPLVLVSQTIHENKNTFCFISERLSLEKLKLNNTGPLLSLK